MLKLDVPPKFGMSPPGSPKLAKSGISPPGPPKLAKSGMFSLCSLELSELAVILLLSELAVASEEAVTSLFFELPEL